MFLLSCLYVITYKLLSRPPYLNRVVQFLQMFTFRLVFSLC